MNLQRSVTRSVIVLIALLGALVLVFGLVVAAQAGHVIEQFDGNLPTGAVCDDPIVGGDGHVSGEYDFAIFREFTGTSFPTWLIVYTHGEDIFVDPDAYDAGRSMWDRLTKCKLPSDPTTTTTQPRDSTTTTTDPPSTTTTTDPGNTTTTSTSTTTVPPVTTTTAPPDVTTTTTTSTASTIGPDPSTTSTAPPPGATTEPPPVGGVSAGGGATAGAGEAAVLWFTGGALALLSGATLLAMKRVPGRN